MVGAEYSAAAGRVAGRRGGDMRRHAPQHGYFVVNAAILAALLALACSPGPAGRGAAPAADAGAGSSSPTPPLKARSAYTTIAVSTSPWWMATEAGYFREQGLDVDMVHVDAGAALLAAVQNNELDVTGGGGP